MKKQRLIGIFIVIMIIIIIVISVIILNMGVSTQETEKLIEIEEGSGSEEEYDYENETVKKVTSSLKFYTVSNCIDTYIERLNINNSEYDYYNEEIEETTQLSEEQINQCIYNLLSEDFIEQNEITTENLREKIEIFEEEITYTPLKMNVLIQDTIEEYVAYGFLIDSEMNFISEIYFDVKVDMVNYTFSIEPISSDEYSDIDEIEIVNKNQEIEQNDVNTFSSITINNKYICEKYLETYKRLVLAWPEKAYEYLDEEYNIFDYEGFIEYRTENYNNLCELALSSYHVEICDGYTKYTCEDTNENTYTFLETEGVMDFTFLLDDYTVEE